MAYVFYNPNPSHKKVGDCVIRAICKLTQQDWESSYTGVVLQGLMMHDMPSSNHVWGEYLYANGYTRHIIPNTCPGCYTVRDFCEENRSGRFLLATGSHVIAVVDGDYYDTWDSGEEVPIYYWRKEY